MNRQLTALFAAFEALLVVAIGIAIPLVPLTFLWGAQYGFAVDWTTFWRAAVDIWLVGHGVDITMVLDPDTAASLGLAGAGAPVTITIAALGFALLTVLLGIRAGRRVAETRFRGLGELASLAAFGLASFAVTLSTGHPDASPSLWQGTVLPTAVFAIGLAIGVGGLVSTRALDGVTRRWQPSTRAAVGTALRAGGAAAAGVVLIAALALAGAIALSYAKIITLYESLHTEVLGGIAITLGQIAFLPDLVIWAASWLIGPGFALGTGSSVSPLGTQLGPVPAIPMLGALPVGQFALGFLGLLVPVVVGFLVGAILGPGLKREAAGALVVVAGIGAGVVGGVILGLLAWASAGSAGPGRLAHVGPDPWAVGFAAALELAISATAGLLASRTRSPAGRQR
ncbi:hypothetical protein BH11ACT4_BH11ACT4_00960 [soil metagenome]